MTKLLEFKEKLNNIYIKFGRYIHPAVKFLMAFTVLTAVNSYIGYDQRLNSVAVVLVLSLGASFMHPGLIVLMSAAFSGFHIYYCSPVLSIVVCLLFLVLYLLVIRFMPQSSYIVLAMPVLFVLKIPYAMPILLGLTLTPVAVIPSACGIIVYYLFAVIKSASVLAGGTSVDDVLDIYKYVIDGLMKNKEMLLVLIVFSIVLFVTYFIRKMAVDYAFNIAIAVGVVVNVLAFLLGNLILNVSNKVVYILIGSLVSGILVWVIQFFRLNLDYSAVEFTQFEDDDYYYYVKAVPKVKIAAPKKDVKTINARRNDDMMDEQEILDFDEDESRSK